MTAGDDFHGADTRSAESPAGGDESRCGGADTTDPTAAPGVWLDSREPPGGPTAPFHPAPATPGVPPRGLAGDAIDGFQLLGVVGKGGMGAVYSARDLDLGREVAIKLLHDGYAPDSAAAARFVEEARVTAQLQHPGIPAVYRVGRTRAGRPYLAMKLIRGRTLDQLLKDKTPVDALAVFEAVAQALGYAHARGVLHRDLKPANVMVGAFGEVQVMDWGLSKVVGAPEAGGGAGPPLSGSGAGGTEHGSALGTPAYMPPEQASGHLDRVDARSDVFGLGGILCSLLTGKPPFGGADAEAVLANAARGETGVALARLDACGADPGAVALCKRCLSADPAGRPQSADEVATAVAGLRRAADDRARVAERDRHAAEVRAAEQAGRRRLAVRLNAVVVAVLVAGFAGTGYGLWRAESARRVSEAKRADAEAAMKFLDDHLLGAARPQGEEGGLGPEVTLRRAIAASLPALGSELAARPLVEARLRRTLGRTYWLLGDDPQSAAQCERACLLFDRELGPDDPESLKATLYLALAYGELGRHDEALALKERVLEARRRLLPPDHPDTLETMVYAAISHAQLGRPEEALRIKRDAAAGYTRALPPDDPATLWAVSNVGYSLAELGRHAEAAALHEAVLEARRRTLAPDHPRVFTSLHNLAVSYSALGRHAEAARCLEEAVRGRRRVLPENHRDLHLSLQKLADEYEWLGRPADALGPRQESLDARHAALPPGHPDALDAQWRLAETMLKCGRDYEATRLAAECADSSVNPGVLVRRARQCRRDADPAGCRAACALFDKLGRTDAASLLDAARARSLAAGLWAKAGRAAEADADALLAVGLIGRAIAAGADKAGLAGDADFEAVRGRADFTRLLEHAD